MTPQLCELGTGGRESAPEFRGTSGDCPSGELPEYEAGASPETELDGTVVERMGLDPDGPGVGRAVPQAVSAAAISRAVPAANRVRGRDGAGVSGT